MNLQVSSIVIHPFAISLTVNNIRISLKCKYFDDFFAGDHYDQQPFNSKSSQNSEFTSTTATTSSNQQQISANSNSSKQDSVTSEFNCDNSKLTSINRVIIFDISSSNNLTDKKSLEKKEDKDESKFSKHLANRNSSFFRRRRQSFTNVWRKTLNTAMSTATGEFFNVFLS